MKSLAVFCGASTGNNPVYVTAARALGKLLAEQGITLVFGGGKVGIMGAIADAVLETGGKAVGVIPRALVAREVAHPNLTQLHVVETMHERKALIAELSEGFVALPGGWGTFDEICEILTWNQLGIINHPCAFLNTNGFYSYLIQMFQTCVEEGFVREERLSNLIVTADEADLLHKMKNYQPLPTPQWMRLNQV
ncbi:TIGR00730 family Rossman fold protein [Adhaeribacter aquaticus]|uniref:LOG family protein n=1 Tax=Adhaeribacter aquaticus TaxID=299567 RepID=UPI000409C01F|nr:TIGR00730 family Rossman fold protein [Adhaeribacter aquaticus]